MIVTLTLNPGLDLTYALAETSVGEVDVHRATTATMEASGKGVNVSRALHANGIATIAVLPLGGSTGHHLSELLVADGVAHRRVEQLGDTRVNTTLALAGGETVKVNGPGGDLGTAAVGALGREVEAALRESAADDGDRWLAVCGSLPPGTDPSRVTDFVALAHAHGFRCAIDASGDALTAAIAAGADLLAPNRLELTEIEPAAAAATSVAQLGEVAAGLSRRIGASLLVSLGSDGALFTDGDVVVHGHGPALVPVNTAGAGDALLSGWLAGPGTPAQRMARAIRWGRAACLAPTTVAPTLGEPTAQGSDPAYGIVVDVLSDITTPTPLERHLR